MLKIVFSSFLLGLTLGSSACMASCGPVLLTYIAGTGKKVLKGLGAYMLFSVSRIFVYAALGVLVFSVGRVVLERSLGVLSKYVFVIGGLLIFVIGIFTAFGKKIGFRYCRQLEHQMIENDRKSMILLGVVTALIPCLPLMAALSYIGLVSKVWFHSLLYSVSFGMGTILSPLIIMAVLAALIPKMLINKPACQRYFSMICGLVIMVLGLRLIRGAF